MYILKLFGHVKVSKKCFCSDKRCTIGRRNTHLIHRSIRTILCVCVYECVCVPGLSIDYSFESECALAGLSMDDTCERKSELEQQYGKMYNSAHARANGFHNVGTFILFSCLSTNISLRNTT